MKDTTWYAAKKDLHRLAACYSGKATWKRLYKRKLIKASRKGMYRIDGKVAGESGWAEGRQCKVLSGGGFMGYLAGGLVSTVEDTVTFVKMLLNDGKLEN